MSTVFVLQNGGIEANPFLADAGKYGILLWKIAMAGPLCLLMKLLHHYNRFYAHFIAGTVYSWFSALTIWNTRIILEEL